jgi:transcriptional regulator with XRE-family HTH domain
MRSAARNTLSYRIAEVIESRGLTAYGVGQLAGVDPGVVARFLSGRRDIRLATADKLAVALGLYLVEAGRTRRPRQADDVGQVDPPAAAATRVAVPTR